MSEAVEVVEEQVETDGQFDMQHADHAYVNEDDVNNEQQFHVLETVVTPYFVTNAPGLPNHNVTDSDVQVMRSFVKRENSTV